MKKSVCFTVILAVIITGLFAGGGQQKAKGPKDHYVFGYIGYDFSTEWGDYAARAFNYAASRAPKKVEVITLDSKLDLEESVKCMESLIQQGVDGISLFPISPEQGFQLIKMANDAGIPITIENYLFNDQPESVTGKFIGAIGCEYDLIGYEAIKFIAQNKPGARVYFCAGQKGGGVVELYEAGVNRAFKEFVVEGKNPNPKHEPLSIVPISASKLSEFIA
jgi:ABC-type sugar transport system substrate-binding protein